MFGGQNTQQAAQLSIPEEDQNLERKPLQSTLSSWDIFSLCYYSRRKRNGKTMCMMLVYFPAVGHVCFMRAEKANSHLLYMGKSTFLTLVLVCLCVCRSGLHHPDAARQPQLVHQPVDLHGVLQQRVQGAAEPAAVRLAAGPPGLATGRLHHHSQLHHQGQPVLTARRSWDAWTLFTPPPPPPPPTQPPTLPPPDVSSYKGRPRSSNRTRPFMTRPLC